MDMKIQKRMDLIPLKDKELQKARIPFAANTFYFWHSKGKNKEIFVKIGGKLFISEEKFWEMARKAQK